MSKEENFWRQKIAEDLELAWKNMPLKNYYSGELLVKIITDFIRKGNRDFLS